MNIIDGKKLAEGINIKVKDEIINNKYNPKLAVILIGEDPASLIYIKRKSRACSGVGITFEKYELNEKVKEKEVIALIKKLNKNSAINAILVQLPLPQHLNTDNIIDTIDPIKDVDGFHVENIKNYVDGKTNFMPGLTGGIIELIKSTGQNLVNKKAVLIAKSEIFTKPLIKALKDEQVSSTWLKPTETVTNYFDYDIIVVAVGQPNYITAEMIKPGTIIIDVGINRLEKGVVGDVYADSLDNIDGYITPVPGGVGPMTIAKLIQNTLTLYKKQ